MEKYYALQDPPKIFGVRQRVLTIYLLEIVLCYLFPFLLFSLGWVYYAISTVVLIAFNSSMRGNMENLYGLLVYRFSVKRWKP